MSFTEKLITLRRTKGLSQEALGEAIGVSRQTVSKWETGITTPELEKLVALADFFDVSLDELVGRAYATEAVVPLTVEQPQPVPRRFQYEFISQRCFRGLPLVHIHVGEGFCRARGIIAIGNLATGLIAIGGLSVGLLSLGGASIGLLALGGLALGVLSLGGLSIGLLALGGIAFGIWAIGGIASAAQVAAGGIASGRVAIGHLSKGVCCFDAATAAPDSIKAAIEAHAGLTPAWLRTLFTWARFVE